MSNARAVKTLIAANVVMFVLQFVAKGRLENALALWPLTPVGGFEHFHVWQIVTYAFLHSTEKIELLRLNLWGLHLPLNLWGLHLLFNMLGLWMFGSEIERYVGPRRLFTCYCASVVAAAITQLVVPPLLGARPSITIGASGGVFGLLLVYALMFPNRKVIPLFPPVPMPAWLFATTYAGLEFILGVTGSQSEIAHFAHLGGMIGSALVAMQWRRLARTRTG